MKRVVICREPATDENNNSQEKETKRKANTQAKAYQVASMRKCKSGIFSIPGRSIGNQFQQKQQIGRDLREEQTFSMFYKFIKT